MATIIKNWLELIKKYFVGLSLQKRILLILCGVLVVFALFGLSILAKRDPYKVLFSELRTDELRDVTKKLGEIKVPYVISDDEKNVLVHESQLDIARLELAKAGIPGQDVVGFEKFDKANIGMSSYIQRIQYIRAIQGELVRSIERLKSVKRARVHISIPPKKTFLEDEIPPKASIVLELHRGLQPTKTEVAGIAHLVASAVEGLKVADISIVDTAGNFLHKPGDEDFSDIKMIQIQQSLEKEYERRIEEMLVPVVGLNKVKAKVAIEIDPSKVSSTEETYDPDKATILSSVKNSEVSSGTKPNPIGIPGSRSNLPGAEVNNPPLPMASTNSEKVTQNSNYAVPKKITMISKPSGTIKRLTASVVVDGKYPKGEKPTIENFIPLNDEELKRIKTLVENAIGFDPDRRDSISVTSMSFANSFLDVSSEETPVMTRKELITELIRNGLIGLVILAFFFLVLKPYLKWFHTKDELLENLPLPKTVEELQSVKLGPKEALLKLSQSSSLVEETDTTSEQKKDEEELKEKIIEKINKAPKKASRIIQDWIEEGNATKVVNG